MALANVGAFVFYGLIEGAGDFLFVKSLQNLFEKCAYGVVEKT